MFILLTVTAFAAEPAPEPRRTGPLTVDVYIDTSESVKGRPEQDVALVQAVQTALRPEDSLRVTGFDGTLRPILAEGPAAAADAPTAFHELAYRGLATFFSPIWIDLSERHVPTDRGHVVIIATDGVSDPLNRKDRPQVDDRTWRDSAPPLGSARVMWVVRDVKVKKGTSAPPLVFTAGAVPARWTEPSGIESTLIFWNPPEGWSAPAADLSSWVTSIRPELPEPVVEEPAVDWAQIGTYAVAAVGAALGLGALGLGAVAAHRRATRAGAELAEGIATRSADRRLRTSTSGESALRIEPTSGEPVERKVRPGDVLDVGPAASWPGIPLSLPGGGLSFRFGSRPDRATVEPRGTRVTVALLRKGLVVTLGTDAPVEVADGDIVIDARSEAPLLKIRLGNPAALAVA